MNDTALDQDDVLPPRAHRMVFELDAASGADTFRIWSAQVAYIGSCKLLDESDRPHFAVKVEVVQIADYSVSTTWISRPQNVVRSEEDVVTSGLSQILIQYYVDASQSGLCNQQALAGEPGDITILDLAQPFDSVFTAGTILALMVPRHALAPSIRDHNLHGSKVGADSGMARMLAQSMQSFAALAGTMSVEEGLVACDALMRLVAGAFGRSGTLVEGGRKPAELSYLQQAQAYVEASIGDPDLSVDRIARDLRLSRSMLYRLFEPQGGIAPYIRERRLLRSYEMIERDMLPDATLGAICFEQGFKSEASSSRAFKERFGISPSAMRRIAKARHRAGLPADPPPNTPGIPPVVFNPRNRRK